MYIISAVVNCSKVIFFKIFQFPIACHVFYGRSLIHSLSPNPISGSPLKMASHQEMPPFSLSSTLLYLQMYKPKVDLALNYGL